MMLDAEKRWDCREVATVSTYLACHAFVHGAFSIPLPQSQLQGPIIGLNLLYLLVENRLAEFHSVVRPDDLYCTASHFCTARIDVLPPGPLSDGQLELLSDAERASTYVKFPTQLEQFLMVGAYDKVGHCRMCPSWLSHVGCVLRLWGGADYPEPFHTACLLQVLDSRKLTPHPIYGYFMSLLVDTVR